MKQIVLSLLVVFLIGCNSSGMLGVTIYEEGACIQEVNKNYAKGFVKKKIYRVDRKVGNDYYLSTFHNSRWIDIRARNVTYFRQSKNFEYDYTDCPKGKKRDRGIASKIKTGIELDK